QEPWAGRHCPHRESKIDRKTSNSLHQAESSCLRAMISTACFRCYRNDGLQIGGNEMTVGRTVSDLEKGDVLGPVEYRVSPFQVREYCHSVEIHQEFFQGGHDQIVSPLL